MAKEILEYNGFKGSVEIELDDGVLYGKLLFVRDLITYEAKDIPGLSAAFRESVDDYLADCNEEGVPPCKPCSGTLQIRMPPELHGKVQLDSYMSDISANLWIVDAIEKKLSLKPSTEIHHHNHTHTHVVSGGNLAKGLWQQDASTHARTFKLVTK